jgi:Reverse transcriptase (RNA-dependent DNA polymerase)
MISTELDLRGAYNLVRIAEREEWKTAFRTCYGHCEYPFGLTNEPALFQMPGNTTLAEFLDRSCVYLDDIMIYSCNEEHVKHVREILAKLREEHIYRSLQLEVSNAQANMGKQMNANLTPHEFQVRDMVRLRRHHMKTQRPSDKLDDKMLGPFKILALVGKTAAKLEIPETMKVHDVFHTSLLTPNRANKVQPTIQPPGLIHIEDEDEWEVEEVLATRKRGRNTWYKVRWKGYDASNDPWARAESRSESMK